MTTKDIPVSFSIIPGRSVSDNIEDYREIIMESALNLSFEEIIIDMVKKNFLEGCQYMMPLLETIQINSIQVNLDISSQFSSTLASYCSGKSDAVAGKYVFKASSSLIGDYLLNSIVPEIPLNPKSSLVWQHELIHMMDHSNISEPNYKNGRPDMTEVLVHLILSFRIEGVAELIYFMTNYSKYRSIKAARTLFLKKIRLYRNLPWEKPQFAKNARGMASGDRDVYTIGAWMVLHVLGCEAYGHKIDEAVQVTLKIKKRQEMTYDEMINIIRHALEMDNYSFIECLTKPGPDGKPFVRYEDLYDLAKAVERAKTLLDGSWINPAVLSGDPNIIRLFRLMRPKPD